jgi:hypothetical protein
MKATLSHTETPSDVLGFFEAVALAGLEHTEMKVSYAVQRKHFGKLVFGKKSVTVNEIGQIFVTWCNGYDITSFDTAFYAFNAIENTLLQTPAISRVKFSTSTL